MRPALLVDELESLPLLGRGRRRAVALCGQLAGWLAAHRAPDLERRVFARAAELALVDESAEAPDRLDHAAILAEEADDPAAVRLRLLQVRALVAVQRADEARALLSTIEGDGFAGDLALARAACDPTDARRHLEQALAVLPSPRQDHDRWEAHLTLAELLEQGGDPVRARPHLEAALALSTTHGDLAGEGLVRAMLGHHLLMTGLPAEAEPHLARAVDLSEQLDDALTLVAESSVLAALQLGRGDWEGALRSARRLAAAARHRGNWLAVADAALTRSAAFAGQGELHAAVAELVNTGERLRHEAPPAALNLLKARLAELRLAHGSAFDHVFAALVPGWNPPAEE